MASSLLVLLLCSVLVGQTYGDLIQFGIIVHHVTGRWPILSYAFYGCYCGLGGSGWPIDAIDWCCHVHDCCYENMSWLGCNPKTEHYKFSCENGNVNCGDLDGCARQTCECDRRAALCFRENYEKYSVSKSFYAKKTKCWGFQPPC